jgi:hypothetical protein
VTQVAEIINAMEQRSAGSAAAPPPSPRGPEAYWGQGRERDDEPRHDEPPYAEESEAAAKKRAAELNEIKKPGPLARSDFFLKMAWR